MEALTSIQPMQLWILPIVGFILLITFGNLGGLKNMVKDSAQFWVGMSVVALGCAIGLVEKTSGNLLIVVLTVVAAFAAGVHFSEFQNYIRGKNKI